MTTPVLPRRLILLLTAAVGIIAANLYYAQPLVGMISRAVGLSTEAAGLVVTLTQIGYGIGVLIAVPLGDLLENKKLVLTMMSISILGLLGLAFVTGLVPYFIAAFLTGLGASTVQILIPYSAHFVPENKRGEVVGNILSGLMLGIMLSRPIASLLSDLLSWHAVFVLSAGLMIALNILLYFVMIPRQPEPLGMNFFSLLRSIGRLFLETELLRRRAIYQAFIFGSFCLFWTASPLLLTGEHFHLSQTGIAIFALVGIAGAVSAPVTGRLADRGYSQLATALALSAGVLAFLLAHFAPDWPILPIPFLAFAGILLDAGVSANLVLGQRAIFALNPQLRGRLNGLYIATIFVGGAFGSALGAWAYAHGGWSLASWAGLAMPLSAFLYFLTERGRFR